MGKRRVLVSALDAGREGTFESFLTEVLDQLKEDLLRECDRIAIARELELKIKLQDALRKNEELRSHFKIMPEVGKEHHDDPMENSCKQEAILVEELLVEPIALVDEDHFEGVNVTPATPDLGNSGLRTIVSIDGCSEQSPEQSVHSENQSIGHKQHFEFTLWEEWEEDVTVPSTAQSVTDIEQQFEQHQLGRHEKAIISLPQHEDANERSKCTVSPSSTAALCWEILGGPVLFYDLTTIPLSVFHAPTGFERDVMSWVPILYWTLDIFLRLFIIGYVTHLGAVELDRKLIMRRYLRCACWFDVLIVAPDWISKAIGEQKMRSVALLRTVRALRLIRLMRMSKLKKLVRDIEDLVDSEYLNALVNLTTNILAILGISHYLACLWFWIGTTDVDGYPSWVEQHLEGAAWEFQYVICLHWAITQFTPGGSRIQPGNIPETIISMIVLIFGVVFLSIFISGITQERMRLQAMTGKHERDNWVLRKFLRQHGVASDLTLRAIRYVDHIILQETRRVQRKDVHLLAYLSLPLQHEVQEEMFYETLHSHPFFRLLRQRSLALTLHLFVNVIVEVFLADTDTVFEAGQVSHEMLFVKSGTLAYLLNGSQEPKIEQVTKSAWVCEPVLWVPWVHRGMAKAVMQSHLICVDSAKMRAAVLEHKERTYVRQCAHGYLKDLNAFMDKEEVVTDIINVSKSLTSEYVMAIYEGEVPGNDV